MNDRRNLICQNYGSSTTHRSHACSDVALFHHGSRMMQRFPRVKVMPVPQAMRLQRITRGLLAASESNASIASTRSSVDMLKTAGKGAKCVRTEQRRRESCDMKPMFLLLPSNSFHIPAIDACGRISVAVEHALHNIKDGSPFTEDDTLFIGFHLADFVQNGLFLGMHLVGALDRFLLFLGLLRFLLFVVLGGCLLG